MWISDEGGGGEKKKSHETFTFNIFFFQPQKNWFLKTFYKKG